ncbi:glycosyltransferase family 9 protein [Pseudodesulfovibrio sp.]|uniref:glycosyltransferase family 9 protein n=1 Tax=unclassified Pseudodesulfovibrio TaxID=2661612 RepID=UPI003B0047FD
MSVSITGSTTSRSEGVLVLPEPGLISLAHIRDLRPGTVLCHETDKASAAEQFPNSRIVTYASGSLTPARADLNELTALVAPVTDAILVRDEDRRHGWDAYITALGLMGATRITLLGQSGSNSVQAQPKGDMAEARSLLLSACGGIGNVIQTTPLLAAAMDLGLKTYFLPLADTPGVSLASLFRGAADGLTVIGPEDLDHIKADIRLNIEARAYRTGGEYFHSPYREPGDRPEPEAYAQFFKNVTGIRPDPIRTFVGGFDAAIPASRRGRVVLCPGSKAGWDSKRWPHFAALAARLDRPLILCREADLDAYDRLDFLHALRGVDAEFVTDASLPEAAAILRAARLVIANDCGLAHLAAATGAATLVLFGPSSKSKNQPLAPNAVSISLDLACQPCQGRQSGPGRLGPGEFSCEIGYPCLKDLSPDRVLAEADALLNASEATA